MKLDEKALRPSLRHHIAHFCPNMDIARQCINKCMERGKPAFCGKDHVCYCGHKYDSHHKDVPVNVNNTYSAFQDLYEKYFGPRLTKGTTTTTNKIENLLKISETDTTHKPNTVENASKESGSKESGSQESGSEEAGSNESGSEEAESKEAGTEEAGSKEAGSKEAGSKEAGSKEAASKENESAESSTTDSATTANAAEKSESTPAEVNAET